MNRLKGRQIWLSKTYESQRLKNLIGCTVWPDMFLFFGRTFSVLTFDFLLLTTQKLSFKYNSATFSNASTPSNARKVNANVALDKYNIGRPIEREKIAHIF